MPNKASVWDNAERKELFREVTLYAYSKTDDKMEDLTLLHSKLESSLLAKASDLPLYLPGRGLYDAMFILFVLLFFKQEDVDCNQLFERSD